MRVPRAGEFLDAGLYRRAFARVRGMLAGGQQGGGGDYEARIQRERETFAQCLEVHNLPQIFHYWSHTYLRPKFLSLGFGHPDEFFAMYLAKAARASTAATPRMVSIGAGNCDTEVRVAKLVRGMGLERFTIECVDLNEDMLRRGREMAAAEGVAEHVVTVQGDFNKWLPDGAYDAVMANQSLHHVLELEHLFDAVARAIGARGLFITSDMIGRNGHQRWPEALAVVREFWAELPGPYRYNQQLRRMEEEFLDWDCAMDGFEGIRAQDVLPCLVERFNFEMFGAYANVIDPFIDRSFGHNFNAAGEWDRAFVDRVHARDEAEIARGAIKPTHMAAVMSGSKAAAGLFLDGRSPRDCIRAA